MEVSVVVITRDEAPRLRLTLESLRRQESAGLDWEVIAVDDGSADETAAVFNEFETWPALKTLALRESRGRAAARNAGARLASGRILLFLDGDTLAGPGMVFAHALHHRSRIGRPFASSIGRGETHHLRGTRFFRDPESGEPYSAAIPYAARIQPHEMPQYLVTLEQVQTDFSAISRRARPGIYPGAAAALVYRAEMEALEADPRSPVLWMAVAAQNVSLPRQEFLACGGFNEQLTINEHRELALRLRSNGIFPAAVSGALSYHMTHRIEPRDPLAEIGRWLPAFSAIAPEEAELLVLFWLTLAGDEEIPPALRLESLQAVRDALTGADSEHRKLFRTHTRLRDLQ